VRSMNAHRVNGFVVLTDVEVDGDRIIQTICDNYDSYVELPDVVKYDNLYYGKSSWSSGSRLCCYKRSARLALVVNNK
jgi:hypothetical protein